jgi:microcin C transport system ATP-binding protein
MLLITHDLGIVRKMADRVCVMTRARSSSRARSRDRSSSARSTPTPACCWPPSRAAARVPAAGDAPSDGAEDLKVWFPIRAACCAARSATSRRSTASARGARGRDGGRGGRERLGQDHARPRPAAPARGARARSASTAATSRAWSFTPQLRPLRREMQIVFQDPYGSLSPRMSVGRSSRRACKVHGLGGTPPSASAR